MSKIERVEGPIRHQLRQLSIERLQEIVDTVRPTQKFQRLCRKRIVKIKVCAPRRDRNQRKSSVIVALRRRYHKPNRWPTPRPITNQYRATIRLGEGRRDILSLCHLLAKVSTILKDGEFRVYGSNNRTWARDYLRLTEWICGKELHDELRQGFIRERIWFRVTGAEIRRRPKRLGRPRKVR